VAERTARPGDELTAKVVSLDERGDGVAETADVRLRVHVSGALPGETVRVRLAHVSGHARDGVRAAWAELLAVLAPSPARVPPPCSAYGSCGGCALMGLAYPAQLGGKRDRVAAELARHPALAAATVADCVASPCTVGYRNQAKYVYGREPSSGRLVLGAFAPRSHRLVDLAGCRVVEPLLAVAWSSRCSTRFGACCSTCSRAGTSSPSTKGAARGRCATWSCGRAWRDG
jgi:23S rRNA (uracil1939-C5)-methyltransferase